MAQAVNLSYGRVKYTPGDPRQTSYGMRINCVISLPDGQDVKLWGDPGDPVLTALSKGQQVTLAQNAKGNWQLATTVPTAQPQLLQGNGENSMAPTTGTGWTPDEKRAIASQVEEKAKLMKFCLEQARKYCSEYLESSEDLRAVAIVLFDQVSK